MQRRSIPNKLESMNRSRRIRFIRLRHRPHSLCTRRREDRERKEGSIPNQRRPPCVHALQIEDADDDRREIPNLNVETLPPIRVVRVLLVVGDVDISLVDGDDGEWGGGLGGFD
jgi:hypothetical protein